MRNDETFNSQESLNLLSCCSRKTPTEVGKTYRRRLIDNRLFSKTLAAAHRVNQSLRILAFLPVEILYRFRA